MAINLLYKHEWPVNDKIQIVIPTVGQIIEDEDAYYGLVGALTSTPYDMMLTLDEAGIDFTAINEYELFLLLFNGLKTVDTSLVFKDINLSNFCLAENTENKQIVLIDRERDIIIDRAIHNKIATVLRHIHGYEKNNRRPGNDEAKRYLLERERKKRKHAKQKESYLEPLIVAMVNTEQYKYDYEETLDLTIYQFNESVHQIVKKVDYDNRMFGIYSGTISAKDMNKSELNWLTHK